MSDARSRSAAKTMTSPPSKSGVIDRAPFVAVVDGSRFAPRASAVAARRRLRGSISAEEVVRGAPAEELLRPAGELLGGIPWAGAAPDPNVLDAVTFLAWL